MNSTPAAMPAAVIGHGSPMNTLESNRFTEAWRAFGRAIPRPRAILCISAHWEMHGTAVTAMPRPRTIHDFYGFPRELFEFQYPAPGAPEVAGEIAEALAPQFVGRDGDSWGLDHGAWSVLAHVYPDAGVPVVQLSLHAGKDAAFHVELGRRLEPLRRKGVLVLGSGNIVHNLRVIRFREPEMAYDWARRFDDAARAIMTTEPARIVELVGHPDFANAVPTAEHFLPFLYHAGLCDAAGEPAGILVDGCTMGSISMTSYTLGCTAAMQASAAKPQPAPMPDSVPPDDANI